MKRDIRTYLGVSIAAVALIVASVWAWRAADRTFANLWLSPDQQGQRQLRQQNYAAAAARFRDPLRKGVAQYRSGDFKNAAASFGRVNSPEAEFNRGNALVMLGKYADAMTSYDKAIKQRPDWQEAKANRALAEARLKRLSGPHEDEGTEGQQKADNIVFDDRPKQTPGEHETQVVTGGEMSDDEVQALWLRRVQTKPADFLRAKFAYQLSRRSEAAPGK